MSTPESPQTGASEQEAPVCYRHPEREAHIRCQRCNRRICPDCMRPASVGFQCPSCVAEGSRTTRSGGTPYGGQRSGNPALTSQVLIGINVLVWVLVLVTGGRSSSLIDLLSLRPDGGLVDFQGGTYSVPPGVADGRVWQLLTAAFMHVEVWHIGFNMLALYALGPQLELAVGRARFLALYLLSALTASAAVMWFAPAYSLTLGASGAIFGLMGALLVVAIKVRGDVRGMLTWIAVNFAFTLLFVRLISWQGHTGGFVGGLLIGAALVYAPRGPARPRYQALGLAGIALLTLAAIVVRVLVLAG
jgi:membrane associated rhomboid family serine protease